MAVSRIRHTTLQLDWMQHDFCFAYRVQIYNAMHLLFIELLSRLPMHKWTGIASALLPESTVMGVIVLIVAIMLRMGI